LSQSSELDQKIENNLVRFSSQFKQSNDSHHLPFPAFASIWHSVNNLSNWLIVEWATWRATWGWLHIQNPS